MSTIAFRFDVDTHKCIRDGVEHLLALSSKYEAPFTFFLNTGCSIDLKDSLHTLQHPPQGKTAPHLSARAKLGNADYLVCALINPPLIRYKKQIAALLQSNCETGIHGGHNHALWARDFPHWDAARIENELDFALANIRRIQPDYQPGGFASPCWISSPSFSALLKCKGFRYSADFHEYGAANPVHRDGPLPVIGVNLLGEPGGVAWFETCVAQGLSTEEIIHRTIAFIESHPLTVLYDHPYFAGCDPRALAATEGVLQEATRRNHTFVTLQTLLEQGCRTC